MPSLCNLCPRKCNTDRSTPSGLRRALCRASQTVQIALVSLHTWEEPCISGKNGAGTVFFSHCNLRCCFCQNYEISDQGKGIEVTEKRLTEIFLEQQERGASCLELVTPTHYLTAIIPALEKAKAAGLSIPVAYNTNGYDAPESLQRLSGLVDIYMPDLKYFDSRLGQKYSGVPHYFETASEAIRIMFSQVGKPVFDKNGLMKRGLIVRHLVLPGLWMDSCNVVSWLYQTFGDDIYLSLMNQYMPLYKAVRHPEINRPLLTLEYQKVLRHTRALGVKNAFQQVGKTAQSKFIPVFDGANVLAQQ